MRLLVTVVRGPGNVGQKAEFSQPGRYVFGCDRGVHFQLSAADPYVSGRHFQIEMDAHQCIRTFPGATSRLKWMHTSASCRIWVAPTNPGSMAVRFPGARSRIRSQCKWVQPGCDSS